MIISLLEIMRNNPIRTNHTTALTSDYPASLQKPSSNFRAPQIKNSHVRVSVASLIQVSEKCPNLQYLNLSYNLSSTLQPDMFIKEVGEFKSNMSFTPPDYLTHIPVTPNNALDRILRNCPRLALIDVRACDWVNMETFEVIARLTRGSKTTTTNGAVSPSFAKSSSSLTSPVAKSLCHFNTLNCVLETPQLVRNFNMNSPQHLALAIEKHLSH